MTAIDALGRLRQLAQTYIEEQDASIFDRHAEAIAAAATIVVQAKLDLPRAIAHHRSLWARYADPATVAAAKAASSPRRAPKGWP